MILDTDNRTVSHLLGDTLVQLASLVRNEVDLARAEIREKAKLIGGAFELLAAGAVLMIPALVLLLFALSAWLMTLGLAAPLAYLISGGGAAIIALALMMVGGGRLSGDALRPNETMREMERNKNLAKELAR